MLRMTLGIKVSISKLCVLHIFLLREDKQKGSVGGWMLLCFGSASPIIYLLSTRVSC